MRRAMRVVGLAVLALAVSAVVAGSASTKPAGPGPGNSPNAKRCQGWQNLFTSAGQGFASAGNCTSYAARGGRLVPLIVSTLTGAAERPNLGDPDAIGTATLQVSLDTGHVCLQLDWANVDGTYSGLHIHEAPPESAGPIRIPFATPPVGASSTSQCVTVGNRALLENLVTNPNQYYINLHSTPLYGGGAIRGQLQAAA